jgi:pimeloyl-ACP methyl ester carboxylesterase
VEERANLVGTVPAFLLTQLQLPAEVELRRSRDVHLNLLKRERTRPNPEAAARMLERLSKEVPPYQKPPELRFSLTVLERDESAISTPGGGYIHITRPLLERLMAEKERGESALAFVLAREVAHTALGHCRRGWQAQALEEDVRKGIEMTVAPSVWRDLLETKVHCTGECMQFLYSRDQEFRADLFAFHLCRNAGVPLDAALDGLRYVAATAVPDAREALLRLKRLLLERDGQVESERDFGLFAFDRSGARMVRCRSGQVAADKSPIIFVHGLYGTGDSWLPFLRYFGEQKVLTDRPLLVFRHPGNGSLARSGHLLWNEMRRVVEAPRQATFVCHSAGGLAFRWYSEILGGSFDRAVILATPHQGSDLTGLKFLLDLLAFAGSLRFGVADGVAKALAEGRGEITLDLHPDSLFLRHLAGDRLLARRYHVFYGEFLGPVKGLALETAFTALRREVEPRLLPFAPEGLARRQAAALVRALVLPAEIVRGDGVVSVTSGRLAGAASNTKLRLMHPAFRSDPEAMRRVLESIAGK